MIGLFVLLWTDPAVEIPDHIFLIILCVWLGVGLIVYGLNEISIQLNRYDNLKLKQLEEIRKKLAAIRQGLDSL